MTSKDVLSALVGHYVWHLWTPNQVKAFPNCCRFGQEMDLAIITKSGYLFEIEIKVSASDFRKEFVSKSDKHRSMRDGTSETPRRGFYFAMPAELYEKIRDQIPDYAGVITVSAEETPWRGNYFEAQIIRKPKVFKCEKISAEKINELNQAIYYKFWNQNTWKPKKELPA